jgi:TolB-like protein/DNA-binding winged helix-turn-helix (wHTH) protein
MRLLLCLAQRAGQTISNDELMDHVWPGTIVTQDSIYQAVASLRRLLGDDPKRPTYIATVPRRGYRLVARVLPSAGTPNETTRSATQWSVARYRKPAVLIGFAALLVAAIALTITSFTTATRSARTASLAVLPFLDLTSQAMEQEYFADGMTEELIDRLSKIPGLQVPSPTASFYFKEHRMPVDAIANALKVAYVLDGSVRESAGKMRVAARLVRAADGFIIWSQTYERESGDVLQIQDEIAAHVAQSLGELRVLQPAVANQAAGSPSR